MSVTVGSLFSGIGGLDLGLERAGMNVIWQSEIDPYACQVLAKHWPTIPNHGDIKTIDWTQIERPNIICGGYPCQPFSQAGKRAGTDDPRHLWPWVKEAISHLRPDFAILENVRGHVSLGLDVVLGEMASIGYDAEWEIISAASQGASHLRERIFIVAYPNGSNPADGRQRENVPSEDQGRRHDGGGSRSDIGEVGLGFARKSASKISDSSLTRSGWFGSLPESRKALFERADKFGREDGFSSGSGFETEPDMDRVADGVPDRLDRLKCLGNAVVPQVSEFVGRIVMECYQ